MPCITATPALPSTSAQLNKFTSITAQELALRGKTRVSLFHLLLKPLWKFVHGYVFRLGFLDGFRRPVHRRHLGLGRVPEIRQAENPHRASARMSPATRPTFLVSRPDAIGDVVLTLPVCGRLQAAAPRLPGGAHRPQLHRRRGRRLPLGG